MNNEIWLSGFLYGVLAGAALGLLLEIWPHV